jgi:Ca2+-binding EF-hand superfamily protein
VGFGSGVDIDSASRSRHESSGDIDREGSGPHVPLQRLSSTAQTNLQKKKLDELFRLHPIAKSYLKYILLFGSAKTRPDLAPVELDHESNAIVTNLFSIIDSDHDGKIDASDMAIVAENVSGMPRYSTASFRKIDRYCVGHVKLPIFLSCFFPLYTPKRLREILLRLEKPLTMITNVRDVLRPEDVRHIQTQYRHFASLPGGFTAENFASVIDPNDEEARGHARREFERFDSNGDGIMEEDDFFEMVKLFYPPFRRSFQLGANQASKNISMILSRWLKEHDPHNYEALELPHIDDIVRQRNDKQYHRGTEALLSIALSKADSHADEASHVLDILRPQRDRRA